MFLQEKEQAGEVRGAGLCVWTRAQLERARASHTNLATDIVHFYWTTGTGLGARRANRTQRTDGNIGHTGEVLGSCHLRCTFVRERLHTSNS